MRLKHGCLAALTAMTLAGCVADDRNEDASGDTARSFDFTGMLAHYADELILPRYRDLAEQTQTLAAEEGPVATYCGAIGGEGETEALSEARQQWRDTMAIWQEVELTRLGPLAENGASLRNRIHSFGSSAPLSSCAVDQGVVLAREPDFDLSRRSVNARGLGAMEYLLFNDNLEHTCPTQIDETRDWNQRPEQERRQWRCDYALELARDLDGAAQQLRSAWEPEEGDYRSEWVHPAHREAHLEALSDALFFIELETKDQKVGVPTGIHGGCNAAACPEAVESRYSETSLEHVRANLEAFRALFNGGEGPGFDDIIVSEGFPEIAEDFDRMVADALALLHTMDQSLYRETLAQLEEGDTTACRNSAANPDSAQGAPACRLHGLLKRITDRLRTDFITIVDLDLPERGQADND